MEIFLVRVPTDEEALHVSQSKSLARSDRSERTTTTEPRVPIDIDALEMVTVRHWFPIPLRKRSTVGKDGSGIE
jgi:hypothetical protein